MDTKKPYKAARPNQLVSAPLFIEGTTRSGKFFLAKLLAGFDRVEAFQYISVLEHLPFLSRLGLLDESTAAALLGTYVDEGCYHMMIGRNLNTRFDDASSIYHHPDATRYLTRALADIDKEAILEAGARNGSIFQFILHESLANAPTYFAAFPELRWLHLERHPVDLAHSWFVRGWDHRFHSDPFSFCPIIQRPEGPSPWFLTDAVDDSAGADRIIDSIATIGSMAEAAYGALTDQQRRQILVTSYERLVEDTAEELERIAGFLGIVARKQLAQIMAREECPKKIKPDARKKKLDELIANASAAKAKVLTELSERYEHHPPFSL